MNKPIHYENELPNLQFKIRTYRSIDKEKVLALLRLNVPKYFAKSEINDLKEYLEFKIEKYFVVELQNEIIGAGGINFDTYKRSAKISWDFIHPEFQGKGAGQKLLVHRLDLLKSSGDIDKIIVRTSQLTYKFYQKKGFLLQNIIKDYWDIGFDLYEMKYQY